MTIVIAKPSDKEIRKELKAIKSASRKIASSPESAKAYLIKQGFLTKDGKKLHSRYGG